MIQVLRAVDKANGYCFGDLEERNLQAMMSAAVGADFQFNSYPFLIVVVTQWLIWFDAKYKDLQEVSEKHKCLQFYWEDFLRQEITANLCVVCQVFLNI